MPSLGAAALAEGGAGTPAGGAPFTGVLVVLGLLAIWASLLLARDRLRLPALGAATVKLTHLLPVAIQLTLLAYWSVYWPAVRVHALVIGGQLGLAYAVDLLLGWSLHRAYTPSLGPWPIVLSTNLFIWFEPADFALSALAITLALASKPLLRRGGKHVFNPSAFGLAVVGVMCIALPERCRYVDITHQLNLPPNMMELIFFLSVIPQVRLGTAPVAFGVWCSMSLVRALGAAAGVAPAFTSPWWAPWLVAATLFAGDPATIPASPTGRLVFGTLLGVAFSATSWVLGFLVGTDYFAKVLPLPLANLLVPTFERWGERLSARVRLPAPWTLDRACLILWTIWLIVGIGDNKAGGFDGSTHLALGTPLVQRDGAGAATCAANPVFCQPFTFGGELALWLR